MRPAGVLVDRFAHVLPVTAALLGVAALGPALATYAPVLAAALLLLGACSGAMDVAINAEAADAESQGRPLMNLAHGAFSASVVVSSLLVGELDARPAVVMGLAAVPTLRRLGDGLRRPRSCAPLGLSWCWARSPRSHS